MKHLLLLFLLVISLNAFTQNTLKNITIIKHQQYTTFFSTALHYPIWVTWYETRVKITCTAPLLRDNLFDKDPSLPNETSLAKDYLNSGFDKGHNCPSKSNLCSGVGAARECFYYSNMTPQYHRVNAGSWENLERICRTLAIQYDSIQVWCGSIGIAKHIGRVAVPTQQWKVYHILRTNAYHAYIFNNNDTDQGNGKNGTEIPIAQLTKLTGYSFK